MHANYNTREEAIKAICSNLLNAGLLLPKEVESYKKAMSRGNNIALAVALVMLVVKDIICPYCLQEWWANKRKEKDEAKKAAQEAIGNSAPQRAIPARHPEGD